MARSTWTIIWRGRSVANQILSLILRGSFQKKVKVRLEDGDQGLWLPFAFERNYLALDKASEDSPFLRRICRKTNGHMHMQFPTPISDAWGRTHQTSGSARHSPVLYRGMESPVTDCWSCCDALVFATALWSMFLAAKTEIESNSHNN